MDPHCSEFLRLQVSSRWSQAQTARELALNPSTVSLHLSGKAVPSLTVLRLFAGLIGDRVLLPGESEGGMDLRDGPRWLEDWEADVVRTLRRLSPRSRGNVIAGIGRIVDAVAPPVAYKITAQAVADAAARDLARTGSGGGASGHAESPATPDANREPMPERPAAEGRKRRRKRGQE